MALKLLWPETEAWLAQAINGNGLRRKQALSLLKIIKKRLQ
jgi:hypothetical protein